VKARPLGPLTLLAAVTLAPGIAFADDAQPAGENAALPAVRPAQAETSTESWTIPTVHGLGLFVTLRLTEAYLYPDPFAETRLSIVGDHYAEAFTRPPKFDTSKPAFEWDGDPWPINVVGHALMGSELYLRART
jgi:hypothetical protein